MMKTILAPFRAVLRFPLVQFSAVIFVIVLFQAADDASFFGQIFGGLDKLVDETVRSVSSVFTVKSFTKSWLTFGFMIAYVYLALWAMFMLCGAVLRSLIDLAGRTNFFGLEIRLPGHEVSRPTGLGCHSREFGPNISLSKCGKSNLRGRQTTGRRIDRLGSALCELRWHICLLRWSCLLYSSFLHHSALSPGWGARLATRLQRQSNLRVTTEVKAACLPH